MAREPVRSLVTVLLGIGLLVLGGMMATTGSASAESPVDAIDVSFTVVNTNTSRVPCPSDGAPYTVRATLVGPRDLLASGRAGSVTVQVPSFGFDAYWALAAVPSYDHAAAMAAEGHVSLVYSPLGYGRSDKPVGQDTCLGSAADVLHQVIGALRQGEYTAGDARPVQFDRVVVASHTSGALITQAEAYSYDDIDGLIVTSWADSGFTEYFWQNTAESSVVCAAGGEPSEGDAGPGGYAYIPPPARFTGTYFSDAEEAVVAAAAASQRRAPCGDFASAGTAAAENQHLLGDVTVPVLLVYGEDDAMWDHPTAGEQHRDRFTGAPSVELVFVPETGGAIALERSAQMLRSTVAGWLCQNGLAAEPACAQRSPRPAAPAAVAGADARNVSAIAPAPILPRTGSDTPLAIAALLLAVGLVVRLVTRTKVASPPAKAGS